MTKKIYRAILIATFISFFCSILVILGTSYSYFNEELETEIESEADYLCAGTEIGGKEYLEKFEEDHRITLIAGNGDVIYDTFDDEYTLENHIDREEVQEALANGVGKSYRYSATLTNKTYNYARLLSNGTILRISVEQITVGAIILRMLVPLLAALLVVILVSATLSQSLAKKVVKPINELDFEKPSIEGYDELSPLLGRLSRQNTLINLQMDDLKKRQEEFLTITHNMSEGLILIDTETQILSYNKSALRLFGLNKTDLGASVLTFNGGEEFTSAVNQVLSGQKCRPVINLNGKSLQLFANPVFVETRVSGAVLVILDVTEKEQRDAMRREFTSNVSHELKTPLTSIYGISEMMLNGIVKAEDMTKFAGDIHKESGRLITLVNDIIKLSQLDEDAPSFEQSETDLFEYAADIAESLALVAEKNNVALSVSGSPCTVCGIPSVLWEMIYNLCDNAIKYNRPGGRVDITVTSADGRPRVTVSDTGIGIPAEHRERVFERFWRVDKSHSRIIGGTGLGLSIVKHGAAIHNAKLRLESEVGVGTTVTITFPIPD